MELHLFVVSVCVNAQCLVGKSEVCIQARGVHGSGNSHGNGIPMGMGIAVWIMIGMGVKAVGMGIAYISCL